MKKLNLEITGAPRGTGKAKTLSSMGFIEGCVHISRVCDAMIEQSVHVAKTLSDTADDMRSKHRALNMLTDKFRDTQTSRR